MVKDSAISLLELGFDSWPRNFHVPRVWQKKKRERETIMKWRAVERIKNSPPNKKIKKKKLVL